MGVKSHITHLRNQPDHKKKRIALLYSGAVTGVIFIVWLSVLEPRGNGPAVADSQPSLEASSFAADTSDIQKQFTDIKQQFSNTEQQFQTVGQQAAAGSAGGSADASSTNNGTNSGASQPTYDFGY